MPASRIQTHNLGMRAAVDLRLGSRGHSDGLIMRLVTENNFQQCSCVLFIRSVTSLMIILMSRNM